MYIYIYIYIYMCVCVCVHVRVQFFNTLLYIIRIYFTTFLEYSSYVLFICLCFSSLQQRGHLETAPPFTVPCEGREGDKYTIPTGNRTLSCCVAVQLH